MVVKMDNQISQYNNADKMTILCWRAPSRLFKKRDKVFFQTVVALVFLIGLILFLLKEFLLIGVVLSLTFVAYVLSTVPPEEVEYRVKVKGFETAGIVTAWEEIAEFWFEEKWGQKMLVLKKKFESGFSSRIIALLGKQDWQVVKEKINAYIPFREAPERTWMDSLSDWFHQHLPFEKS